MAQAKKPSKKVVKEPEVVATSVEDELLGVLNIKPQGKKEDRQTFLDRVVQSVGEMSDEDFGELSEETRAWFAEAVEVYNANVEAKAGDEEDLPDFPDLPVEVPDAEGEGEGGEEEDAGEGEGEEGAEEGADETEDEQEEVKVAAKKTAGKSKTSKMKAKAIQTKKVVGKAKTAPAKKAAKKNSVGINFREGSVREKAYGIFQEMIAKGKDRPAILAAFAKLGWADATCKTQYQVFKNL